MIIRRMLVPVFLSVIGTLIAQAQSPDAFMEQGNDAYMAEDYDEALRLYRKVFQMEVESAPLYHNIGNAWYQKGHIGKAIVNYERALQISPSYAPSLHNLDIANSRIINPIEEMPLMFYQRWHNGFIRMFSADNWARMGITALFIMVLCIAMLIVSHRIWRKKLFFVLAVIFLLLSILSFYAAARQHHHRYKVREVVVTEHMQHVNSAPAGRGKDLFVIYEGTKAKIINEVDGWLELRFADGNVGWVDLAAVAII